MEYKIKKIISKVLLYLLLIIIATITLGPFLWLLGTSLKSASESVYGYPPKFIPEKITFINYAKAMEAFPFFKYLFNSVFVSVITVTSNIIISSLAGFALSRIDFKGKNIIFIMILSTMIVPFQMLMIPLYELCILLGIENSYLGLAVPHLVTAFGIFIMRQAFLKVPKELDESAFIDGASTFTLWLKILLPVVKPSIVTLAIFSFVSSWGDFLWPLIIVNKENYFTLPLGVNKLNGIFVADMKIISSGAILSIIPMLIVFLSLQKYFISGATEGSLKG